MPRGDRCNHAANKEDEGGGHGSCRAAPYTAHAVAAGAAGPQSCAHANQHSASYEQMRREIRAFRHSVRAEYCDQYRAADYAKQENTSPQTVVRTTPYDTVQMAGDSSNTARSDP